MLKRVYNRQDVDDIMHKSSKAVLGSQHDLYRLMTDLDYLNEATAASIVALPVKDEDKMTVQQVQKLLRTFYVLHGNEKGGNSLIQKEDLFRLLRLPELQFDANRFFVTKWMLEATDKLEGQVNMEKFCTAAQ